MSDDFINENKRTVELQINLGKMLQAKGAKALQEIDLSIEPASVILKAIELGIQIEKSAKKNKRKKSLTEW